MFRALKFFLLIFICSVRCQHLEGKPDSIVEFPSVDGKEWRAIKVKLDGTEVLIEFCLVNYDRYSEEPWKNPMDMHLQRVSKCNVKSGTKKVFSLDRIRQYMTEKEGFYEPAGFIHHETRCGSTLLSNMIAHVPGTIMVTEPMIPADIISTRKMWGNYMAEEEQLQTIHDVMKSLCFSSHGRSRCFIKSVGAFNLDIWTSAFPDTPWIFLFRDPVEVVSSHLGGQWIKRNEFFHEAEDGSVIQVDKPPRIPCLSWYKESHNRLDQEDLCVQNLSKLCQHAIDALISNPETGLAVNYKNIPDVFVDFLWENHFKQNAEAAERDKVYLIGASKMYSKGTQGEEKFSQGSDAEIKKRHISDKALNAINNSSITELYEQLELLQKWHKD